MGKGLEPRKALGGYRKSAWVNPDVILLVCPTVI